MVYLNTKDKLNDFIKKHNITITDSKINKHLKKGSINEKLTIFFFLFFIVAIIISFLALILNDKIAGLVLCIPIFFISMLFSSISNYHFNKVEDYIYMNFVKDRVKTFNSIELLKNYSYDIVKEDAVTVTDNYDSKKYLEFKTFDLNADGYVIAHKNKYTKTSGYIPKGGDGEITSTTYTEYEVTFIKNIKKLEQPKNISNNIENIESNKDLNYWFELKEKGAITQEEYEKKKKEFLG